ncbi:Phox homologous domain-containing protein [Crassisporium funariophilum]|nr:Phox homologous domain-containing protein [Crassisporium funariophilum]
MSRASTSSSTASASVTSVSAFGSSSYSSSSSTSQTPRSSSSPPVHPFANSKAKLEIIPSSTANDKIDVEAEARLFDELCRSYEDETEAAPPESIFSADIYLSDNTGPGHTPTMAFAQDVHIAGWTTVGDGAGKPGKGTGAYVVYDCVISTKEGTTMHLLKRYSAFEELHDVLKRTLPQSLLPLLLSLPPKAPLSKFRPAFLDSRRKLLQFWLASVLLHPELGGREVVRSWVLK